MLLVQPKKMQKDSPSCSRFRASRASSSHWLNTSTLPDMLFDTSENTFFSVLSRSARSCNPRVMRSTLSCCGRMSFSHLKSGSPCFHSSNFWRTGVRQTADRWDGTYATELHSAADCGTQHQVPQLKDSPDDTRDDGDSARVAGIQDGAAGDEELPLSQQTGMAQQTGWTGHDTRLAQQTRDRHSLCMHTHVADSHTDFIPSTGHPNPLHRPSPVSLTHRPLGHWQMGKRT